jgi:hypothetical protein
MVTAVTSNGVKIRSRGAPQDIADKDQDWDHKQGNLEARPHGNPKRKVHIVLHGDDNSG